MTAYFHFFADQFLSPSVGDPYPLNTDCDEEPVFESSTLYAHITREWFRRVEQDSVFASSVLKALCFVKWGAETHALKVFHAGAHLPFVITRDDFYWEMRYAECLVQGRKVRHFPAFLDGLNPDLLSGCLTILRGSGHRSEDESPLSTGCVMAGIEKFLSSPHIWGLVEMTAAHLIQSDEYLTSGDVFHAMLEKAWPKAERLAGPYSGPFLQTKPRVNPAAVAEALPF